MDEQIKKKIIEELNLGGLPSDEQDQAIEKIGGMIFQGLFARIMENLNEEKQRELNETLVRAVGNPELLFSFLKDNVPDFESILKEEVEKFKSESSSALEEIKKQ